MINSNCFAQLHLKWYSVGINQFWIKLSVSPHIGSNFFRSSSRQGTLGDRVLEIRKKKLRQKKCSAPAESLLFEVFLNIQIFWTVHEHFKNKFKNNKKYLDIPMKFEQHLNSSWTVHELVQKNIKIWLETPGLFETFLMMCRSTSGISLLVWIDFFPNSWITMTVGFTSVGIPFPRST